MNEFKLKEKIECEGETQNFLRTFRKQKFSVKFLFQLEWPDADQTQK
jgi:hypothetical protein